MDTKRAHLLYRLMLTAREVDERERVLIAQNLAHFHVSGAGHEAVAALADHLTATDWLHLHYRDKALLLARGLPIVEFFRSLLCRGGSHSDGRQMSAHFSAPHLGILSMVGPVGNNALQAVGVAAAVKDQPEHPIVVCSVGDGTTQEGEYYEAVAEAVRRELPVLFLVEDNRYSISTTTRSQTFFDLPGGPAREFFGIPIQHVDGSDVDALDSVFAATVNQMRSSRSPAIVVLHVERLCDHTNADDQARYRPETESPIALAARDPLHRLAEHFKIDETPIQAEVRALVGVAAAEAVELAPPALQLGAKPPFPAKYFERREYLGHASQPQLNMQQAINAVLRQHLQNDPQVFLYGEDIEDPKGDVFGVTRGLSTAFPGRVVNSALSESTIVGTSIGRALAGQRPVAFIQFADFLPLAYNQILSELGSMYWRTNGGWSCPVILMVTCGGYKPGLGPFHAQTLESVMAHTPGIDVVMPSSAGDAAGLLNAAFDSERPTVFFYPKSCLNLEDRRTSDDVEQQFVPLGKARQLRSGNDLTLVTWGSPIQQCLQATAVLETEGVKVDLFDLRSISPWDVETVLGSVERTGRLVVVHEDNSTCGFGAEVLAIVAERASRPVASRRVCRADTYVPCHFTSQLELLPSFRRVLDACAELVGIDVEWQEEEQEDPGIGVIRAIGSGPADDRVEILEIQVQVGDEIKPGQVVAMVEATKSVVEIVSTITGQVVAVLSKPGDRVPVGQVLIRAQVSEGAYSDVPLTQENSGTPRLSRRPLPELVITPRVLPAVGRGQESQNRIDHIYLSRPECVLGTRVISTESIAQNIPGWTAADAIKKTGVATRHWIGDGETAVELVTRAANRMLDALGADVPRITAVFCSTASPQEATPSVSCQVATQLMQRNCFADPWLAFDFNAACSGFIYGLRLAFEHLQGDESVAVLLLTSETLSPTLNKTDPVTAFLFGDAASACIITKTPVKTPSFRVSRPLVAATPDFDSSIRGPCHGSAETLRMDGIAVARSAYKVMANTLRQAATMQQLSPTDLAVVLPHPGSKRIMQNIGEYLDVPASRIWHTLADHGNTSSTSIPLSMNRYWDQLPRSEKIGLVAFGAGYTSAATIGEIF